MNFYALLYFNRDIHVKKKKRKELKHIIMLSSRLKRKPCNKFNSILLFLLLLSSCKTMNQDKSNFEHIENYVTDQNKTLVKNDTNMSASTFLSISSSATNVAKPFQEKEGIIIIEEITSAAAWIETLVCIGVSTSCAFMWTTGASAPNVMSQWMNVSLSQINWLSNASAICNTVFSLLTAWAYERIGIKASVNTV